jgi:hypothetical protein
MRITISHNRSKEDVMRSVDRSFNELFADGSGLPLQFVVQQKNWQGSTLNFSLGAKLGFVTTPIKGTIEVTDRDITIDADLGVLERFISEKTAQEVIGNRLKGLLN